MKVILLNTPLKETKITRDMAGGLGFDATRQTLLPPIDLAILATTLRKEKNQVKIIDSETDSLSFSETIEKILRWKPDVIIANVSLPSLKTPCYDLEKFAGNIIRLLEDKELYERTAKEAIAWAREWDWDKKAEEVWEVLQTQLLSKKL